jgi:hypothetical protein
MGSASSSGDRHFPQHPISPLTQHSTSHNSVNCASINDRAFGLPSTYLGATFCVGPTASDVGILVWCWGRCFCRKIVKSLITLSILIPFLRTLCVSHSSRLTLEGPVLRYLIDTPVMAQHSTAGHGEHHELFDDTGPNASDPTRFYTDFRHRLRIRSPFVSRCRRSRTR